MRVEWLNFRLTFEAQTPAEDEALRAVWIAFGSQMDERPGVDDYESDSGKFPDPVPAQSLDGVSN